MYSRSDIDKVSERGETCAMDQELREALDRLAEDLRGEIRSGDAETRAYVDERMGSLTSETRRHFDVVGESLRTEIRSLAELMAMAIERMDREFDERGRRTDGLEGRVLGLEARVLILEDDRKPRRPRRRQ
jgi:hypothetical protein